MTTRSKIAAVVGITVLAAGALAVAYVATDRERALALFGGVPTEERPLTRATAPAQPAPEAAPPAQVEMATRLPGPRPQMVDPDAPLAARPRLVSPGPQEPRRVAPQGRDVAEPPAAAAAEAPVQQAAVPPEAAEAPAQQQAAILRKPEPEPAQQAAIPPEAAEAPAEQQAAILRKPEPEPAPEPAPAQQQALAAPEPAQQAVIRPKPAPAPAQQQAAVSPKPAPEPAPAQQQAAILPKPAEAPAQQAAIPPEAAEAPAQQQAAVLPKPKPAPVQQAVIPPEAAEAPAQQQAVAEPAQQAVIWPKPAPGPVQQQAVVSPKPAPEPAPAQQQAAVLPKPAPAPAQLAAIPPKPAPEAEPAQQAAIAPKPAVAPAPVQQAALPPAKDVIPATMPDFDIVRVNAKGAAVIAGRGEPDCVVTVLDGDRAIGEVRADNRGEWVLLPDSPLPPGSRELSLSQDCGDGGAAKSQHVVILIVPEPGKDLAGRPAKRPVMPLAMKVERGGGGAAIVLQTPTLPDPELVVGELAGKDEPLTRVAPVVAPALDPRARPPAGRMQVTVDAVSYNDDGRVVVAGKAPPDSRQRAYLDNRFIGEADADAEGRWSLTPEQPIAPGFYNLRVDQVDAAGAVVARVELPFIRGEPMTDLPEGALVVVQPGNSLWRIARRVYGQGIEYSVIYSANSRQIADPDMIYPGQVFVLPQTN